MAKLKVTNAKRVKSDLKKAIIKAARDKDIRLGIGELIVEDIQDNPLASAGDVTQSFRQFFEQFNRTDPKYRRTKINMTFTGELMKDLKRNVKADIQGTSVSYIIEQSGRFHKNLKSGGTFKPKTTTVKNKKGKKSKRQVKKTHKEIGQFVEAKGYDYLSFKPRLLDKLSQFIQRKLGENVQKNL